MRPGGALDRTDTVKLRTLLEAFPQGRLLLGSADIEIAGVAYDSRKVQRGDLFVAIQGYRADGHDFVPQAIARGATAVVVDEEHPNLTVPEGVALVCAPDGRRALSRLSAAFYEYPARRMRTIGITGTNGKTTVAYLLSFILEAAGHRTGVLSSIEIKVGDLVRTNQTRRTTQESLDTQTLLTEMAGAGVEYAIIESTSHGLALQRVADCDFDVAVFTNLTRDHFDFHQTREQYLADKALLFKYLGEAVDKGVPKTSVLNADDESIHTLRGVAPDRVLTYGIDNAAEVMATDLVFSGPLPSFRLRAPGHEAPLALAVPGRHNVYNALAAASAALALGIGFDVVIDALARFSGLRGRLHPIECGQAFAVYVDYAHTPDALRKVLETARLQAALQHVILVFGAAGGRDSQKRPMMGELGCELSDFCIVTNEDPVEEDPTAIIAQIETGIVAAGGKRDLDYAVVIDRREAIKMALSRAQRGDVVLITGKGHERTMSVGADELPWDEVEVVREVLQEVLQRRTA